MRDSRSIKITFLKSLKIFGQSDVEGEREVGEGERFFRIFNLIESRERKDSWRE